MLGKGGFGIIFEKKYHTAYHRASTVPYGEILGFEAMLQSACVAEIASRAGYRSSFSETFFSSVGCGAVGQLIDYNISQINEA